MSDYNNYDTTAVTGEESQQSMSLLNMAQKVHDGFITEANEKAQEIISSAESEAQSVIQNAKQEAEDIVNNAIEEYNNYTTRIEELKRVEFEYRARLKSAADDTLVSLENMTTSANNDSPMYDDSPVYDEGTYEEDDLTEEESFSFFTKE